MGWDIRRQKSYVLGPVMTRWYSFGIFFGGIGTGIGMGISMGLRRNWDGTGWDRI